MVGRHIRRGRLRALLWSGGRGAIAEAVIALAPIWKLLGAGRRDERGSIAPMTAVLGIVLIGSAALAVDVSIWEGNVGMMQGAADQAALAAGLAMSAGIPAAKKEANGVAAAYGFVDGTGSVTVAPNISSTTYVIEVVIKQSQTAFLSGLSLASPPTASVRAVATPVPAPTCILMLATTGPGITSSANGGVNASGCNIYVNSGSACDVSTSGTSVVTGFDVFVGEQSQAGCSTPLSSFYARNKLQLGATPALDPYASRTIPTPPTPCTPISKSSSSFTLDPGTYCGLTVSGVQSVTLNSGVYVFDGSEGLNASQNSQITGKNVTLVFTSSGSQYGGVTVGGNVIINLTPMTTGNTAGMAIWLDKAGQRSLTLAQNTSFNVTGAVYAPGSAVTWSGNANSSCMQLIASSTSFSGNATATFKHSCSDLGTADVASYKLSE